MKTRCVVLDRPGRMRVEERDVPERPSEGSVLVKVEAVGICGSDIHAYNGTQPFQTYPRILGHEICGTVVEGNDRHPAGERVVVEPLLRCGKCYPCSIGRYNCCVNLRVIGVHEDGGMRDLLWLPSELLYRVPRGIRVDEAALCEPLAVASHANTRAKVGEGDVVAVIGAGPIGLLILQVSRALGARVVVSDIDAERLKVASTLGAEHTVDASSPGHLEEMRTLAGRDGPTVVFEAVGSDETIAEAVGLVSPAGRVVLVGLYGSPVEFTPIEIIRREFDLLGSRNSSGMFPHALSLIETGKVQLGPLITHRFDLEEAPRVFEGIRRGTIRPLKALLLA